MTKLIFLLALPLLGQQQTFKKVTINQTGGGSALALSGGTVTMGGTTVLDTSRNGTVANLAMSGNFTGTHAQNVGTADTVTFAGVNIDADFRMDSTVTNVLDIRDSGSSSRLSLNGSGAGGFGWYLNAPSIIASPTNAASYALHAEAYASGSADVAQFTSAASATNFLTVGHSGDLTGAHIQNIGTTDFPILNGTFYRPSAATSGFSWSVGSTVTNVLDFKDSGSSTRMFLNATGAGGFGVYVGAPSLYAQPTNAASWALKAIGYASGTADIFVAESSGGTNYFTVSHTGNLSGSHIQNIGTGDTITVAGCTGCGSGVTSVSGTSPIASSGGATPAISCSTCLTTSSLTAGTGISISGGTAITNAGLVGLGASVPTRLYTGNAQFSSGTVTVSTGLAAISSCVAIIVNAGIGSADGVTAGTASGGDCTFYSTLSSASTAFIYYMIAGTP